jgi:hypothetical protein
LAGIGAGWRMISSVSIWWLPLRFCWPDYFCGGEAEGSGTVPSVLKTILETRFGQHLRNQLIHRGILPARDYTVRKSRGSLVRKWGHVAIDRTGGVRAGIRTRRKV